jgi:hypothetical protein
MCPQGAEAESSSRYDASSSSSDDIRGDDINIRGGGIGQGERE